MTDYAVVVGIARYPLLAHDGFAQDLEGPDNDAHAVREWLVDPDGGRLDPANVRMVSSAQFVPVDPDDPRPGTPLVQKALQWIEEQTRDQPGGRLYLYFSGHGFSPVLEEGALFTAEATVVSPAHVYAHAWLRWFRRAKRFRESVLWMDSCMNYQQSIPVNEVLMRTQTGTGMPGPAFWALAAQTGSAIEYPMTDGLVHGVFTWTLLKALRGGACDDRGRVTGESLRSFLYTVMPEFLPEDARRMPSVDLQPFVRADEGMVFHRRASRPTYPVRLTVPADARGHRLTVWGGRPHRVVATQAALGESWCGELVRGLYVVEVPDAGYRHGLQVSGVGPVEQTIAERGDPVRPPDQDALFTLDVKPDNPATDIAVNDYLFDRVFTETGMLSERDVPGVYKVRMQSGRDLTGVSDRVFLLDRDTVIGLPGAAALPSPAPIPGSAMTHEYHSEPFVDAAQRRGPFLSPEPGRATLSVLARYWTSPGQQHRSLPHPMKGLSLLDTDGALVARLEVNCRFQDLRGDPVAIWEQELAPGAYFLRQVLLDGRTFEGCIVAVADWVTQIALQRSVEPAVGTGDAALFMRRSHGSTCSSNQDAAIESARIALTQGRNLFGGGRGADLRELLLTKYDDPIAGIIGCHLLLRALDPAEPDPQLTGLFDAAVANLRALVGLDHPDVQALSLRCSDPGLRTTEPFTVPPMFSDSWQLITDASYRQPDLVPAAMWQRVHAATHFGPYFAWAADENARKVHGDLLTKWMDSQAQADSSLGPPESAPQRSTVSFAPESPAPAFELMVPTIASSDSDSLTAEALAAGRRLQVPAAAVATLWQNR